MRIVEEKKLLFSCRNEEGTINDLKLKREPDNILVVEINLKNPCKVRGNNSVKSMNSCLMTTPTSNTQSRFFSNISKKKEDRESIERRGRGSLENSMDAYKKLGKSSTPISDRLRFLANSTGTQHSLSR